MKKIIQKIKEILGINQKIKSSTEEDLGSQDTSQKLTEEQEKIKFIEKSWNQREEEVYKKLFPNLPEEIYTVQDPNSIPVGGKLLRELSYGVFSIPPTDDRPYWLYITSGLSNPFDQDKRISGFGFELMIATKEKEKWAINILTNLMGDILSRGIVLDYDNQMDIEGKDFGDIAGLVFTEPDFLKKKSFKLQQQKFKLILTLGITEEELKFSSENDVEDLVRRLKEKEVYPLTSIKRGTVLNK